MKKLLFVCVAFAASLLFSKNTSAQQVKIGYFDEQQTLSLFPGIGKIDTLMGIYRSDSLGVEYNYTYSDYLRRDSIFKKDSATMPAKARELAVGELNRAKYKLVNWQTYAQQMEEGHLEQLLTPYKQRMFDAMKQIVTEQKYTLVLNAASLSPYAQPPLLDNLSIRVAMKLKLPLPKDVENAWKAASGGGATSAPAKK